MKYEVMEMQTSRAPFVFSNFGRIHFWFVDKLGYRPPVSLLFLSVIVYKGAGSRSSRSPQFSGNRPGPNQHPYGGGIDGPFPPPSIKRHHGHPVKKAANIDPGEKSRQTPHDSLEKAGPSRPLPPEIALAQRLSVFFCSILATLLSRRSIFFLKTESQGDHQKPELDPGMTFNERKYPTHAKPIEPQDPT